MPINRLKPLYLASGWFGFIQTKLWCKDQWLSVEANWSPTNRIHVNFEFVAWKQLEILLVLIRRNGRQPWQHSSSGLLSSLLFLKDPVAQQGEAVLGANLLKASHSIALRMYYRPSSTTAINDAFESIKCPLLQRYPSIPRYFDISLWQHLQ